MKLLELLLRRWRQWPLLRRILIHIKVTMQGTAHGHCFTRQSNYLQNELLTSVFPFRFFAFDVVTFWPQFALHQLVIGWCVCVPLSPSPIHIILWLFSNAFNLVNAHNICIACVNTQIFNWNMSKPFSVWKVLNVFTYVATASLFVHAFLARVARTKPYEAYKILNKERACRRGESRRAPRVY